MNYQKVRYLLPVGTSNYNYIPCDGKSIARNRIAHHGDAFASTYIVSLLRCCLHSTDPLAIPGSLTNQRTHGASSGVAPSAQTRLLPPARGGPVDWSTAPSGALGGTLGGGRSVACRLHHGCAGSVHGLQQAAAAAAAAAGGRAAGGGTAGELASSWPPQPPPPPLPLLPRSTSEMSVGGMGITPAVWTRDPVEKRRRRTWPISPATSSGESRQGS